MKVYLFTHTDLDGAIPIIIMHRLSSQLNFDILTQACDYANIDERIMELISTLDTAETAETCAVLITDICPTEMVCEQLEQLRRRHPAIEVQLIDHHVTKKWVSKYEWALFSTEAAASKLFATWLLEERAGIGNTLKMFWSREGADTAIAKYTAIAEAADAWDRWQLDSPHRPRGENLNTLLHFLGMENFVQLFVENVEFDQSGWGQKLLDMLLRRKERIIRHLVEDQVQSSPNRMDDLGNTYKIIFANDFISDVAHAVLEHPNCDDLHYVVVVNLQYNTCSLRARPRAETGVNFVSVAQIAKLVGGGGHDEAAGFPLDFRKKAEYLVFHTLDTLSSKVEKEKKPSAG